LTALHRFSRVERTSVNGIALAHTALDAREVVRKCRELFREEFAIEHAVKWVPIDHWCDTDLEAIRKLLRDEVRGKISERETWGMKVEKRWWQRYHTHDIVMELAQEIDRKVDLDHPDKLVRVDVVGERTAVSVLGPKEIFSAATSD
jgi:tRNA acetyltransferase TAN1